MILPVIIIADLNFTMKVGEQSTIVERGFILLRKKTTARGMLKDQVWTDMVGSKIVVKAMVVPGQTINMEQ